MINPTTMLADSQTANMLYCVGPAYEQLRNVKELLNEQYQVTAFTCVEQLKEALAKNHPDLVLCHYSLLQLNQDLLSSFTKITHQESRILVLGPPLSVAEQVTVLKQGARGYFQEDLLDGKLAIALDLIKRGEVWVERHVIAGLIDALTHAPKISQEQQRQIESLSKKELEVADLVSHGATNKMIANKMNITERTVKAHLTTIFQKLAIADRLSLAIFFRDMR